MKKVLLTSAFALFALTFAQAQVSSSCADGSCTITTPCSTFTGEGSIARTESFLINGVITYKGFIDGQQVLECSSGSKPPSNDGPVIIIRDGTDNPIFDRPKRDVRSLLGRRSG
jgi:DnaJ-class molecular chaperone